MAKGLNFLFCLNTTFFIINFFFNTHQCIGFNGFAKSRGRILIWIWFGFDLDLIWKPSKSRLAVRSNFWVWVPHNSLSLSFSGARTQKEWVEFALRFLSSAYFFFGNNKKGSVSPMDISDLAPEKREGEFTKKSGEEWEDKGYFERKNWVERRSFYLILCTVQTQFFWVKQNSKIEFEFDFAQSLSALAESLVERGNFGTGAFVNSWLID